MEKSENHRVQFIAKMCSEYSRCISGANLKVIAKRLGVHVENVRTEGRKMLLSCYISECSEQDHAAVYIIREIRECMGGVGEIQGFEWDELKWILNDTVYICVT